MNWLRKIIMAEGERTRNAGIALGIRPPPDGPFTPMHRIELMSLTLRGMDRILLLR